MPIKVIAAGAFGGLAFVAFHVAILGLFFFLRDDSLLTKFSRSEFGLAEALWNLGPVLLFTLPHSFLLTPLGRTVTRALPPKLHMTAYSLHASLSLMLMYALWRPGEVLFEFSGGWRTVVDVLSALSWSLMAWSIYATGALRQIGVEQCLAYMRERPLSYRLPYSGPYRFMRHPIYVSFFGMIWFCPQWDGPRLLLALSWSLYLVLGARLKDRRLLRNKDYRVYYQNTPATPFQLLSPRRVRAAQGK